MSDINDKQCVALAAANHVKDGMCIGLGTGSTANYFIEELARRQQAGLNITTVSSSIVSAIKARSLGLTVIAIEQLTTLDLYVDGADEVTSDFILLKGRGSDLVREKLLAQACKHMIVMVDNSKLVQGIGEKFPIPIEVPAFAWQLVLQSLKALGGQGSLRKNTTGDGLAVTSHGSLVLDMRFDKTIDGQTLNKILNNIPGLVEHGIFVDLASTILIAQDGKVEERGSLLIR